MCLVKSEHAQGNAQTYLVRKKNSIHCSISKPNEKWGSPTLPKPDICFRHHPRVTDNNTRNKQRHTPFCLCVTFFSS
jgi:hypothetical protein